MLRRPRTHRVYSRRICATRVFLHGRTTGFVPHTDVPFPVYSDAMVERLCGRGEDLVRILYGPNDTPVIFSRGNHQASSDGVVDQT